MNRIFRELGMLCRDIVGRGKLHIGRNLKSGCSKHKYSERRNIKRESGRLIEIAVKLIPENRGEQ